MSVEASSWAWKQDVSSGAKLVLLALADHADANGFCWPGVEGLSQKCSLGRSTIWRHMQELEDGQFVARVQRNAQAGRKTNSYQLNLEGKDFPQVPNRDVGNSDREGCVDATNSCSISPKSQIETPQVPNQQLPTSQNGTWLNRKEPSIESPIESSSELFGLENPDWFKTLESIEGWPTKFGKAEMWRMDKNISVELAETTAYALRDWWLKLKPAESAKRNPYYTWQAWCRRAVAEQKRPSPGQPRASPRASRADINTDYQSFNRG